MALAAVCERKKRTSQHLHPFHQEKKRSSKRRGSKEVGVWFIPSQHKTQSQHQLTPSPYPQAVPWRTMNSSMARGSRSPSHLEPPSPRTRPPLHWSNGCNPGILSALPVALRGRRLGVRVRSLDGSGGFGGGGSGGCWCLLHSRQLWINKFFILVHWFGHIWCPCFGLVGCLFVFLSFFLPGVAPPVELEVGWGGMFPESPFVIFLYWCCLR